MLFTRQIKYSPSIEAGELQLVEGKLVGMVGKVLWGGCQQRDEGAG